MVCACVMYLCYDSRSHVLIVSVCATYHIWHSLPYMVLRNLYGTWYSLPYMVLPTIYGAAYLPVWRPLALACVLEKVISEVLGHNIVIQQPLLLGVLCKRDMYNTSTNGVLP